MTPGGGAPQNRPACLARRRRHDVTAPPVRLDFIHHFAVNYSGCSSPDDFPWAVLAARGSRSVVMVALRLKSWWRPSLVFALAAAIFVALAAATAAASEQIKVELDQAKLIKLPERVSTVVVGNPLIADAAVQPGGIIVITAKSYGVTNLVALDRTGTTLMEHSIHVLGPVDNVVEIGRAHV